MDDEKLVRAIELARTLEKRAIRQRNYESIEAAWIMIEMVDYICEQEGIAIHERMAIKLAELDNASDAK